MVPAQLVAFFSSIDKHDLELVGGKGANLGEMTKAGFPVPPGFAVTVPSYELFLKENNLSDYIYGQLKGLDTEDSHKLELASRNIQNKLKNTKFPDSVALETMRAYKKLSGRFRQALVAVRSSATAEDLPGASFAGQQATFLNVKGEANLLNYIRECWASLFTPRSIYYRVTNKIDHEKVGISVIVQKMVQSEVSGVMFSIDPVTNDKEKIVIESVWGLGEMIVQGSVVPDSYTVQKETYAILSKEISDQAIQLIRKGDTNIEAKVPDKIRDRQKISDEEIIKLAKYAAGLQKHYFFPQDIEWAKEGKNLYITQTRPITTMGKAKAEVKDGVTSAGNAFLKGVAASPGIGVGKVKVLKSPKEISRIETGDVLVASMTSPDYVPAMKKASAIVTDHGGQTSHAAIVSRELGVPCVVGTKEATKKLTEAMTVTVNGATGEVFLGSTMKASKVEKVKEKVVRTRTATNLYVNMAEVDRVPEISKLYVDGVGLLRAEFMIANIGVHPKEAIKRKEQDEFVNRLARDISIFCKNFGDRPVVYRATDFKTNEYRSLPGGKFWEPEESNPMLGFRGAIRYIADPEVFNLELEAIKKVREKYKNLALMIPFVRSPEELAKVRRLVSGSGLFDNPSFKFWMMVELPVNVILIEEFIKVGIDGVSIGSNDLTMLVTGTDRDNSEVTSVFDERSPAVLWSLKRVIKACNKHGITSSICGQAPSQYDDLVEKLVEWGVTSVSVNADAVNRVRGVIARAEAGVAGVK